MANLTFFTHRAMLNWMRGSSPGAITQLFVGVMQNQPNQDGTGVVEPGGNYARKTITFGSPTTSGAITSMANVGDIIFNTASQDWPQVNYAGVFDQDGHLLFYGVLAAPRLIKSGDALGLAEGSVQLKLQ